MSFERSQFCGASVRSFSSSLSWGAGGPSQLTVQLVEDPRNNDDFTVPEVGTPLFFQFGALRFHGLLQSYKEASEIGGFPTHDVVLVDPREILDGTQVILAGYTGSVGTTRNLLNVFGYWENAGGFGASYSNEAGMPWFRIRDAILSLVNQPLYGTYGGPLTYHGVAYGIDLSQLPAPPDYYRVGGTVVSLLDLVAQICEDGGHDFFVELNGYTIRIRTVSRRSQPSLGTIAALASAGNGTTVTRSQVGREARNEATTSFLVGGEVTTLWLTDALRSFWGYDVDGAPILGTEQRVDLLDTRCKARLAQDITVDAGLIQLDQFRLSEALTNDSAWPGIAVPYYVRIDNEIIRIDRVDGFGWFGCTRGQFGSTATAHTTGAVATLSWRSVTCDTFTLNVSPIADIMGTVSYYCTELELRLARANYESWAAYIMAYRPEVAARIGMTSPVRNLGGGGLILRPNLGNDERANAVLMAQGAILSDIHNREMRVYELMRGYANDYMGRKYAAGLPFIVSKQDPETLRITTSYEVTDSGYLPEGASPLGISAANADVFQNPDTRYRAFVKFDNLTDADFSLLSPDGTVIENGLLFMEAQADVNIVYAPTPMALVTLPGALTETATDPVGDVDVLAATLQMTVERAQEVFRRAQFGNVISKVSPAVIKPVAVGVPLKSNTLFYGPWYVAGPAGKVKFEQDPSLVPWNYGGYTTMNLAGNARVSEALSSTQIVEQGTLEKVGAPTISLGDALQLNGPAVTNIQVSYGPNGVTTTYSWHTYTPRFGLFSKGNQERLRRLTQTNTNLARSLRTLSRQQRGRQTVLATAARANARFMANAPAAVRRETPHDTLVGFSVVDTEASGIIRTGISAATFDEAIAFSSADSDAGWQATSTMSWQGLLRPFSTKVGGGVAMSSYTAPSGGFEAMSKTALDPWKAQNDIEIYAYGDTYSGLHALRREGETSNARPFALRGPLVISGWGYDWEGRPTPSGSTSTTWHSSYLKRPDLWKTGPVDLLWDNRRGVWTCHDMVRGVTEASIAPSGASSGSVRVHGSGSSTTWVLPAYNWGSSTLASGTRVHATYSVLDNRWYATSASTTVGGSGNLTVQNSGSVSYANIATLEVITSQGLSFSDGGGNKGILALAEASLTQTGSITTGPQSFSGTKKLIGGYAWEVLDATGYTERASLSSNLFGLTNADNSANVYLQIGGMTTTPAPYPGWYMYAGGFTAYSGVEPGIFRCSPVVGGTHVTTLSLPSRGIALVSSYTGGFASGSAPINSAYAVLDSLGLVHSGAYAETYGLRFHGGLYTGGAISGVISDGTHGDIDVSGSTWTIPSGSITNGKLADMPAWSIKLRNSASLGPPQDAAAGDLTEEATPAAGMKLFGFDGSSQIRLFDIGNLPSGVGGGTITNSHLAQMPAYTLKANLTASPANPSDAAVADFATEAIASASGLIGFTTTNELRLFSVSELIGSYTNEEAQDAVGGILDDGTGGDIIFYYDDAAPTISGAIKSGALGNSLFAPMAGYSLKANLTGSSAVPTDVVLGDLTELSPPGTGVYCFGFDEGTGEPVKFSIANLLVSGSGDFAYKPGLPGGQTICGGSSTSEQLTLRGTSHSSLGQVVIQSSLFHVAGAFGLDTEDTVLLSGDGDLSLPSGAAIIWLDASSPVTVYGIIPAYGINGHTVILCNSGANDITLENESGSSGAASRRMALNGNIVIGADCSVIMRYSNSESRWRCVGAYVA